MGASKKSSKTVPNGSGQPFQGRAKLKATAKAMKALRDREAREAKRQAQIAAEREERLATERHLDLVERSVKAQHVGYAALGVALGNIAAKDAALELGVERSQTGAVHVLARDGLKWLVRKGHLNAAHERAGLRFREDWRTATGSGVVSCLAVEAGGRAFDPATSGPTQRMLGARDRVQAALRALGTPMLHGYVQHIAGDGAMLSGPEFMADSRRVNDHVLPCVIAFDLLARHYGHIR